MNKFLASLLASTCLTLGAVEAQLPGVTLNGRVERVTSGCDPAAGYRITCSDVQLKSSTVDLSQWVNRTVTLTGTPEVRVGCITVDVATIENAAARTTLLALGGYRIGTSVIITTTAPAGAVVAYVFGAENAFVPLGQFGTYLMDPLTSVYWTFDLSIGLAVRNLPIPRDPALVGHRALFQVVYGAVTPTFELGILNPNCFTITQ